MGDLTLDTSRFESALALLWSYSKRTLAEEFQTATRGIINGVYSVTPPAAGKKAKEKVSEFDSASKLRGIKRIESDLRGIFQPVALKGQRQITTVFGNRLATPVTVPTRERIPDVDAAYRERDSHRHGGRMTRGGRAALYVDAAKLRALAQRQESHVGYAAAGFNTAARAVGARIPSYARGINAPSNGFLKITDESLHFRVENLVRYISTMEHNDMQRRLQYAVELQANAMQRRIPHMARAIGEAAGFRVR